MDALDVFPAAPIHGMAGNLPLAGSGPVGTQVNTMV